MNTKKHAALALGLGMILLSVAGCSDENNPIAALEPEIINTADAFQFQITGANGVTTVLDYSWINGEARATVDHSTALTGGSAIVSLLDAGGTRVYSSDLVASATETTTSGDAGPWTVRVVLTGFRGTANFRVEPL